MDVREAYSGGVKRDDVRHSIGEDGGGTAEGYGHVPYHRTEYTARSITMHVSIDVGQIESYGLSALATELLLAVARWEVRSLLDSGLRLRTACEFELLNDDGVAGLDDADTLASQIRALVDQGVPELAESAEPPMIVRWSDRKKRSK